MIFGWTEVMNLPVWFIFVQNNCLFHYKAVRSNLTFCWVPLFLKCGASRSPFICQIEQTTLYPCNLMKSPESFPCKCKSSFVIFLSNSMLSFQVQEGKVLFVKGKIHQSQRVTESISLEKISEITEFTQWPNTTVSARPWPWVPCAVFP